MNAQHSLGRLLGGRGALMAELLLKRGTNPGSVNVDSLKRERYAMPKDFERASKMVRSQLEGIAL